MYYTISDFANMYAGGVKLVAGGGGMSRPIKNVGILDYELDAALKDRYAQTNIQEGQFILTSFLYAKDSPYLINDAVKHLVAKGASGLAVRNVFRLTFPDSALRYADSKNFPIFMINSMKIYFEDIVYEVRRLAEQMKDLYFPQSELDRILTCGGGEDAALCARRINPSFGESCFAIYFHGADYFGEADFLGFYERFENSEYFSPQNRLCLYKRGVFLFCSGEVDADESFVRRAVTALDPEGGCSAGAGAAHFTLREFGKCAKEALCASLINSVSKEPYNMYCRLGVYKALFPFAGSAEAAAFCRGVLDPIKEYDAENNAEIFLTLERYVVSGCSARAAASALGIHENTLRYRLEKAASVTGLSFRSQEQMEQLSLAVKLELCARLMRGL